MKFEKNIKLFIWFRVLFNSRFYYPVFTVLFLDFGLSLEQFALLNTLWAICIFLFDVPAGALADVIGRRQLMIAAAVFMIFEMLSLLLVPLGDKHLVFYAFVLNRIFSGAAESCASGADEALAYETLTEVGEEKKAAWSLVLQRLARYQSIGFVIAMVVGGAVYDPRLLRHFIDIPDSLRVKLPVILTFISSIFVFFIVWQMRDPLRPSERMALGQSLRQANRYIFETAVWIFRTPFAMAILAGGFIFDSVMRMFMTLSSQYYRVIGFPESSFGIIGSAMAALGFVVPVIGRKLLHKQKPFSNFLLLAGVVFVSLLGISKVYPIWWGLFFAVLLCSCFTLLNFFMSSYLNEIAESSRRATLLSFKSLSFNLFYALVGLAYAALIKSIEASGNHESFQAALPAFTWYFAGMIGLYLLALSLLRAFV